MDRLGFRIQLSLIICFLSVTVSDKPSGLQTYSPSTILRTSIRKSSVTKEPCRWTDIQCRETTDQTETTNPKASEWRENCVFIEDYEQIFSCASICAKQKHREECQSYCPGQSIRYLVDKPVY